MTAPAVDALLSDPAYLLFDLRRGPELLFAQVDEATYTQSAFLDHRITPRPQTFFPLPLRAAVDQRECLPEPPALYIAHTSFCCSTLLARCLQAPALMALREPRVLGGLANEYRRGLPVAQVDALAEPVIRLLGKRVAGAEKVLVKGTNFTNNLAPVWKRLWPDTRLLLMWGTLEDFLISMCRHRQEAGRNLWPFLQAFLIDAGIAQAQHRAWQTLPLLQQAVWVWRLQILCFSEWLQQYPESRCLAASDFLTNPESTVRAVHAWLGVDVEATVREQQVATVMRRDAKRQGEVDQDHGSARAAVRTDYAAEIEATLAWAAKEELLVDTASLKSHCLV